MAGIGSSGPAVNGTIAIEGQFQPGLFSNVRMWTANPKSFLIPPPRQIPAERPADLQSVLSMQEWNKLRADVEGAYKPLIDKLRIWHPLGNIASVLAPCIFFIILIIFLAQFLGIENEYLGAAAEYYDSDVDDNIFMRMLPTLSLIALFTLNSIALPCIVRSAQPGCHARLDQICADLTANHPECASG
eukprot:TRINITY_DN5057_c0_g1_i3.p2 TRINITY_DN5057_c0_g1~~TRINITY_DN5057_c0_g1_i3.p2  ORF type:complete len:188 (+),score=28.80 TRINITY_DN5057_c0_g1_i3:64-627(+)